MEGLKREFQGRSINEKKQAHEGSKEDRKEGGGNRDVGADEMENSGSTPLILTEAIPEIKKSVLHSIAYDETNPEKMKLTMKYKRLIDNTIELSAAYDLELNQVQTKADQLGVEYRQASTACDLLEAEASARLEEAQMELDELLSRYEWYRSPMTAGLERREEGVVAGLYGLTSFNPNSNTHSHCVRRSPLDRG